MSNICVRRGRFILCGLTFAACIVAALSFEADAVGAKKNMRGRVAPRAQEGRIDIRLRSFAPNASGQLTIEPSTEGGRARLTALSLPDPQSQSRDARTYVVWANSEGRIVRLGELLTDSRGNGGLSFTHPGFERYTVIVTAEPSGDAQQPFGAPVLSTRANEATPVFPSPDPVPTPAPLPTTVPTPERTTRPMRRGAGGDFYSEVDGALDASGGGRILDLEGAELAPRARGRARAAEQAGRAYVVVRFSDVPLPSTVGAGTYAMWGLLPNGRIVYMGSLPADDSINTGTTYVRVSGFDSDQFDLFVTAERARPVSAPSNDRALSTRNARNTIR